MDFQPLYYQEAISDFREARQKAALQQIMAHLTGRSIDLLSYDEVRRKLMATGRIERGVREIPLDAIVGTVGRYADFTRTFLPRHRRTEHRWARLKAAVDEKAIDALPPIDVYQIGEVYFVRDGHHRVSVARQAGLTHIPAQVIEVRSRVPLTPDVKPDDLIVKAEYAGFLEFTHLDRLRPAADLSVSVPGQYRRLEDHIEVHRYFEEVEQGRDIPYEEAAGRWYDEVYLPVARAIRERGILRHFPGRTETDLYLWISDHSVALQKELGWQIKPEVAVEKLAAQFDIRSEHRVTRVGQAVLDAVTPEVLKDGPTPGRWRRERLMARYSDRLFADILVPISGESNGWQAVELALLVARREPSQIYGLHVVPTESDKLSDAVQAIRAEFERRCRESGVDGRLVLDVGEVAHKICERAVLTDLVVLSLAHPPAVRPSARLGSGIRQVIRRCATPLLFVPDRAGPISRALLAYDGSAKSNEALFAAAYLAERWKTPLIVLTVVEAGRADLDTQDHARRYLEMHEVQATFVQERGPVADIVLKSIKDRQCDLILMGGYGYSPMLDLVLGSSVDRVLRESRLPTLICR